MSPHDPRLTRSVARHFNDLQGLSTATISALFVVGAGVWLATGNEAMTFYATLAMVIAGLADHVLLVKGLRGIRSTEREHSR